MQIATLSALAIRSLTLADSHTQSLVTHNDCSPDKNVNVIIGNNDNGES